MRLSNDQVQIYSHVMTLFLRCVPEIVIINLAFLSALDDKKFAKRTTTAKLHTSRHRNYFPN